MKQAILIFIASIICNCLTVPSETIRLKYGLEIYKKPVQYALKRTNTDTLMDIIYMELSKCDLGLDYQAILPTLKVKFCDYVAPSYSTGELNTVCELSDSIVSGHAPGKTVFVAWRGKVHRTSFAHEIMHQLMANSGFGPDYNHESKPYWDCVNAINKSLKEGDL